MNTTTLGIVTCLVVSFFPLTALGAPDGTPFTSSRVVAEALQNNGELLALRDELGIAEAEASRAALHPDPVVEFGLDTGKVTGSRGEERYQAGISRELLSFGKKHLSSVVANRELDAARERVRNAERLLTLDVKERFHGLISAQKQVELAQKAVVFGQELVRVAEERFLTGDIAEIDVSLARVEALRAQERVVAAEGVVIALRAELAQSLGLPPDIILDVVDNPPGKMPVVDAATLAEQALRQRPDLNALMLEQEKNGTAVKLAQAERWPNVTVGIVYSREQSTEGEGLLEERSTDDLLGLRLSLPLATMTRREALLREATARQSGGGRRLAALQAAVVREVKVAAAKFAVAESVLRLYQVDILPRVQENLKTVHEAYRLGEIGILNVIEEQRRHLEVNNDYVVILRDRNIAVAQLEAAAGIELAQMEGDLR